MTRSDDVHAALLATYERLFPIADGGRFDHRAGHALMLLPMFPSSALNGVLVEAEPAPGIAESVREVEALGLPAGIHLRRVVIPASRKKPLRSASPTGASCPR